MTPKAIARRYASALFDVVKKQKTGDTTAREVSTLAGIVASHDELRKALESPAVPITQKKAVMDALMKAVGPVSDEVRRMVALLADNDRLTSLPEIARAFDAQLMKAKGTVPAQFVTAVAMPEQTRDALAKALGKLLGADVIVTTRLDPAVVGGVVATVGGTVYDGSVAGQLNRLKQRLSAET
jgi:F-type H+-transporting ATPase subunit delta